MCSVTLILRYIQQKGFIIVVIKLFVLEVIRGKLEQEEVNWSKFTPCLRIRDSYKYRFYSSAL